jgi:hypothetical protein
VNAREKREFSRGEIDERRLARDVMLPPATCRDGRFDDPREQLTSHYFGSTSYEVAGCTHPRRYVDRCLFAIRTAADRGLTVATASGAAGTAAACIAGDHTSRTAGRNSEPARSSSATSRCIGEAPEARGHDIVTCDARCSACGRRSASRSCTKTRGATATTTARVP